MAYFINYWNFNEIRKYNHKHSNVSQQIEPIPEQTLKIVFTGRAPRSLLIFL